MLEFTAREAPLLEQDWDTNLSQYKISECAAEGDFHKSPNPAVPSLWQQSFSFTFYFSSSWLLISCPPPPPSFILFFAQQHKGWAGKARAHILWISPAPCHISLPTRDQALHYPETPNSNSSPASARIFSFWVASGNIDFTTPAWQQKASSKVLQLSILHLKSLTRPLYSRHRQQFTSFCSCSRLSGVLYVEPSWFFKPSLY